MAFRDLIPWRRQVNWLPVPVSAEGGRDSDTHPMLSLHREVDRQFDGLFRAFGVPALAGLYRAAGWPHVELGETDKEIRATAKLPGLDEKDVDITVEDGALTLRGERRSKVENKDFGYPDRSDNCFEGRIRLLEDIDRDNANAAFKNGALTVTLPKMEAANENVRPNPVNGKAA